MAVGLRRSGGGRTDSVEAFAGAQGQRGERGCEIGGWGVRQLPDGATDRKRTPAHNGRYATMAAPPSAISRVAGRTENAVPRADRTALTVALGVSRRA